MIWGISLAAAILAVGFFWLGHIAVRKRIGSGTPNQWGRFVLDLIAGVFTAVAFIPLIQWASGASWFAIGAAVAFAGLALGTVIDIASDKKPDRWAIFSAKVLPALLLVTMWAGGQAALDEGHSLFSSYTAQMTAGR